MEGPSLHTLSVNIAWDRDCTQGTGAASLFNAVSSCLQLLHHVAEPGSGTLAAVPQASVISESHMPDPASWADVHAQSLQDLQQASAAHASAQSGVGTPALTEAALTKVVLARRTGMTLQGPMHGLQLLNMLQQTNTASYHIALVLPTGETFVASTPERLYRRTNRMVHSEAVAGVVSLNNLK